jgi:hypothetical protein
VTRQPTSPLLLLPPSLLQRQKACIGSYASLSVYQKRQGQRIRDMLDSGQIPTQHPELLLPAFWEGQSPVPGLVCRFSPSTHPAMCYSPHPLFPLPLTEWLDGDYTYNFTLLNPTGVRGHGNI